MTISSSLDGPILVALANAGKPLTVSQIATISVRGSEIGIRKSIGRLIEQGIVTATELGNVRVHSLNRDHVAADIPTLLAGLRSELFKRILASLDSWKVRPLYACVFGSAARHDGDSGSDIDLLLVRPATRSEIVAKQSNAPMKAALDLGVTAVTSRIMAQSNLAIWEESVDRLHDEVRKWSGNPLQVVSISSIEWAEHRRKKTAIYKNIVADEVRLYEETATSVITYAHEDAPS
jgi:predicted nucleotidyltransferase